MRDHRDHGGPPREPGGPAPASAGPRSPGHDAAAVRPDDAPPAPRSLDEAVARMARLEAELVEAQAAAAATQDQFLRERAELENYKRRMQKDKAESLRYATEPVLRDLIGVIDNLERAIKAAREEAAREGGPSGPLGALLTGVEMVLSQFADVLSRHGVSRIAARHEPFDPAHHEALAQVESHEHPAGTVVEEHAAGYRLHDRLLRPAQVTVTRTPPGSPPSGPRN